MLLGSLKTCSIIQSQRTYQIKRYLFIVVAGFDKPQQKLITCGAFKSYILLSWKKAPMYETVQSPIIFSGLIK